MADSNNEKVTSETAQSGNNVIENNKRLYDDDLPFGAPTLVDPSDRPKKPGDCAEMKEEISRIRGELDEIKEQIEATRKVMKILFDEQQKILENVSNQLEDLVK